MPPQTQTIALSLKSPALLQKLASDEVLVDDKVYQARELAKVHPGKIRYSFFHDLTSLLMIGGEIFVQAFAGRDATEAFLSYHRRKFPHDRFSQHLVKKSTAKKLPNADQDYLELCDLIEKILPRHRSYAPFTYYVKISILIAITLGLELYMHLTRSYFWYFTAIEGFFFALVGLNIQHDANHGAISKYAPINRWLGLLQNYIGGSSLDWIHQHVVQVCNEPL